MRLERADVTHGCTPADRAATSSRARQWLSYWIAISAVAIPIVTIGGKDPLRLAKQISFTTAGIVSAAMMLVAVVLGRIELPSEKDWRRMEVALPGAIVAWTVVATLLSSNRGESFSALVWVVSAIALFLCATLALHSRPVSVLWFLLAPAALNAAVVILQSLAIWNPFRFPDAVPLRDRAVGLIGNTNDVGSYLIVPALAALAAAAAVRGVLRWAFGICALLCMTALVTSQLITAIVALTVGICTLLWLAGWRTRSILLALIVVGAAGIAMYKPIRVRIITKAVALTMGNFDSVLSSRLPGFLAATEMFLHNPLTGVGPGTFGFNYFEYRLQADSRYSAQVSSINVSNFGEAHNDHLQTLATAGLPGYVLMLTCFFVIGRRSIGERTEFEDSKRRFVRLFSLPFAAAVFILAAAQFPLELGGSLLTIVGCAAIVVAWSKS